MLMIPYYYEMDICGNHQLLTLPHWQKLNFFATIF